jgi:ATP-dependent Clp protease ATP-binding subunit ClpA
MDHGTLTDAQGKPADFRHIILIMTSNVGAREMNQRKLGFGDSPIKDGEDEKAFKRFFAPEFRNRLDARISFGSLSMDIVLKIVGKFIDELAGLLTARHVQISVTDTAREWLAGKGYDPQMGARPLARVVESDLKRPLTEELLFGRLEHGGRVAVGLKDDKLAFEFTAATTNEIAARGAPKKPAVKP